jgi:hypothetical protein
MKTLLLALALATFGAEEQTPRALDLLEASGQQYEKAGNGWAVKFTGNNLKDIRIIVVQTDALVVAVSYLALKDEIADKAGLHEALLTINEDYDVVKALLDDDGDYALRMDLIPHGLTGKLFSEQLVQIATATDLLKPIIDKFRKK